MEFHPKLGTFHRKYGRLDRPAFLAIFRRPFLVFELASGEPPPDAFEEYAESTTGDTGTVMLPGSAGKSARLHVAALHKSDRNDYQGRITIGRSAANDVVLPHPGVSKFHACLRPEGRHRGYTLWDAASRFGTYLEGGRLEAGVGHPLRSKDAVDFAGAVSALFLSPGDFFAYMNAVTGRSAARV